MRCRRCGGILVGAINNKNVYDANDYMLVLKTLECVDCGLRVRIK